MRISVVQRLRTGEWHLLCQALALLQLPGHFHGVPGEALHHGETPMAPVLHTAGVRLPGQLQCPFGVGPDLVGAPGPGVEKDEAPVDLGEETRVPHRFGRGQRLLHIPYGLIVTAHFCQADASGQLESCGGDILASRLGGGQPFLQASQRLRETPTPVVDQSDLPVCGGHRGKVALLGGQSPGPLPQGLSLGVVADPCECSRQIDDDGSLPLLRYRDASPLRCIDSLESPVQVGHRLPVRRSGKG